ncbi:SDR family NAD(P)-dependent oxidoreductase [bacterium]|nr:SDR family NAD(P)-dependent oxidoreductase [bacterium]
MNLTGKSAFISGGTSGIGLAVAIEFARLGADVFAFSLDDEAAAGAAMASIRRAARSDAQRAAFARVDVTDRDTVLRVLGEAASSFGAPDVLVNSAGIGGAQYFEQMAYERFDRTIRVNVYGCRNAIEALLPAMRNQSRKRQRAGSSASRETHAHIINVASFSGLVGVVGYTAYSASKFALVGFTQALRGELAPHGINVAVMCPPQVDTPMMRKTDPEKPPETKALNDRAGVLSPESVARELVRGMERGRFLIVPGRRARMFHRLERFFPRLRERMTMRVVEKFATEDTNE